MIRKTRKQKGGVLENYSNTDYRTGTITIDETDYNIGPSAYLEGVNLREAHLEKAYLVRANLQGAHLEGAHLEKAYLVSADLTGAHLERADLRGADLSRADLTGAHLENITYNTDTIWPEEVTIPESAVLEQVSESESEQYKIILTENMTKSNNSNSCNYLLYKKIMSLTLEEIEKKIFKFKGQTGIDEGGLSRIVHDLFLKSFINKFFVGSLTKILGNQFNYEELYQATERLIALTNKTKGSINFFPIEPNLLNILLAKNVQDYINQNKNKNKYYKRTYPHKIYNLLNKVNRNEIGIDLINATNATNVTNETIKNYLIAFLTINGFNSYKQYLNMRKWIQTYWNPEMFSNHLSFDFETFSERVLLKFKNNEGIFSPEVKLSYFIKNNHSADYNKYNLLPLFLEYLLSDNEQYRINFTMLVSGSSTYGGILRIIFEATPSDKLYHAHTCSCEINIYNNEVGMSINDLNGAIEGEIKNIKIQD